MKHRDPRGFLLLISSILCLFLVAEVGIRTLDAWNGNGFFSDHRNLVKQRKQRTIAFPFRTFGFDLYKEIDGKRYILSSHGDPYLLEKQPDTIRIVALGGSTTQNIIGGPDYPRSLQKMLKERHPDKNIEVINLGMSAYATPHSLILLELDVLSWSPDFVILSHNANDLLATYFKDFTFDYSNKYAHPFYYANYGAQFSLPNQILQWSHFYWFLRGKIINTWTYHTDFRRESYGPEPPQVSQEVFRRNLETFAAIAQSNGIHVLFGTQPLEPSKEYWERHMGFKHFSRFYDAVIYPLHEEFVSHHRRFNEIIREVAREMKATLVDNTFSDQKYFVDFVHNTPEGIEKLAENYFYVLETKL